MLLKVCDTDTSLLDQINCLADSWVSVYWVVMVIPYHFFHHLHTELVELCPWNWVSVQILLEYGSFTFIFVHVVFSSAECVCSPILLSRGVQDLEFVLPEEFGPSDLSSVQLLCCGERCQILVVREDGEFRTAFRIHSPVFECIDNCQ